eukprot:CAMPEP_0201575662 /NCGR_PEP_ID=MMETSP0190_2-20130828/21008_1 /ASSEMBLY_ACC=CAM_ASM_000263 /TAXON_ID=37353 /ORGANISM="Rosalina sp." /LENGTH=162 /DNA_ID=CAMNT_0048005565 /DNA_START=667 /DNA_END=1152 /DNA_ORIENTATION=+
MKIARKLNGLMDHRVVAAAIPAAALADGMSEEARANEIYDELKKTMQEYQDELSRRHTQTESMDEQAQFAANFAAIAAELGLNDNDDIKEESENEESNDNYNQFDMNNVNHSNSMVMGPTPSHSLMSRSSNNANYNNYGNNEHNDNILIENDEEENLNMNMN